MGAGDAVWCGFEAHLAVECVGEGRYTGRCVAGRDDRVFGGHLVAHAIVIACSESAADFVPLSLHAHFLAAASSQLPIDYQVLVLRRGRTFEHWRIDAMQGGRLVLTSTVALHRPETSPQHSAVRPADDDPLTLPTITNFPRAGTSTQIREGLDIRRGEHWQEGEATPYQHIWYRCVEKLPDDPVLRYAILAWITDLELTWTVDLPYREGVVSRVGASLDHVIYFHRELDPCQWWLYDQASPTLGAGRGLSTGRMFGADGALGASVNQLSLLRLERRQGADGKGNGQVHAD